MNSNAAHLKSSDFFRPDIEGLRGIAVLLVVACHCGVSWCTGGFVGVDVFFVLSGYLITGLLAAEYRATSRIDLVSFYARRARRLLPACLLVLAATALVAAVILAPQEMAFASRAALAASMYVSNVFFDQNSSDYFSPDVESNPLLHTWSLGLEEQFYLVWPLLILILCRRVDSAKRLSWVFCIAIALSLVCCVYFTRRVPTFAFYELPARVWEFAAGGLLSQLPAPPLATRGRCTSASGILGMALILGSGLLIKPTSGFPGWIAIIPVSGTLAILFAGARAPKQGIARLLGTKPLQYIGARSYGFYLWHWPFVVFAAALFPNIGITGKILASIVSLIAASLTFRYVERPIRASNFLSKRPGLSLRIAGATTLLTIGAAVALGLYGQELAMDSTYRSISAATTDISEMSIRSCLSQGPTPDVKMCSFGSDGAMRVVVLFGDSHAVQWFNAFRKAADIEGWRLVTVVRFGCVAEDVNPPELSAAAQVCKEWRAGAIAKIIAMRPSAVVLASYTGATIRGFREARPITPEELRTGSRRTLERFSNAHVPVVVFRDSPLPPFDIPVCVARSVSQSSQYAGNCDFAAKGALNEIAFSAQQESASGLRNIYFLDLSDLICQGGSCPAMQHGQLVYRDDNHLTGTFAGTLTSTLRTRLFQLLGNEQ